MSGTLLERVAAAAERDPAAVRPVLQVLAGEVPDRVSMLRPIAERVNAERRQAALDEFKAGAWTTEDVLRNIRRFRSRQAVHALRARERLVGRTIGNATWFPRWQFSAGDLRHELSTLLDALSQFSNDAVACDRVMRVPRPELNGRSIAEALDRPREQRLAWRILNAVGGAD